MSENEIQTPAEEAAIEVKTDAVETQGAVTESLVEAAAATETQAEEVKVEATTEAVETETNKVDSQTAEAAPTEPPAEVKEEPAEPEEISYHAVEKEGEITAIWEMQGQKHLRTIDPRSTEGLKIFALFTSDIHETDSPPLASQATS